MSFGKVSLLQLLARKKTAHHLSFRSKQFQWKPIQHDANRINSYHSLPLCELADTQLAFHKPNLAAELDDPFQLEI